MPGESDFAGAELGSADLVWKLGACGDSVTTCAFLMIRCLDLFPDGSGAGTRQLAETGDSAGEPFSLIKEAEYRYSSSGEAQTLTIAVRVSKSLRDTWERSPLLDPGLDTSSRDREYSRAKSDLDEYPAGFLVEKIEFTKFENVAGLRFPTAGEFKRYTLSRKRVPGEAPREIHYATWRVELRSAGLSAAAEIRLPPSPAGKKVFVTETRLTDRSLHINGVNFTTNHFTSTEVSAAARLAFDEQARLARRRIFIASLKRISPFAIIGLAVALALIWPRANRAHR